MNKKVLIVDDDPVVRILASEFLGSRGYDVETLDNGTECLAKLNKEQPDVLVLDMLMPDLTGIDVLKQLKDNPQTSKIPIVMLSADTDSEAVLQNADVSADCYVRKPFSVSEIVQAMEEVNLKKGS